jgi:glycosyltransferase involved in cell wall biosynthesis
MMQASIIIPSYNSEGTIKHCLDSILAQDCIDKSEVIVVDSSIDRTPEIVRKDYPTVIYYHLDRKTDPGTARNLGIVRSRGDVLAFIDSDCIARPGWLSRLLSLHSEGDHSVVGGAVENANPRSIVSLGSYVLEFSDFLPTMERGLVAHLPTCNISYKRAVFDRFGGFDHRYYPQEDYYFHWRLKKAGQRIYFDPSILVAHNHRTGWRSYLAHQRRIGRITSRVLKVTDLPGSGFVRRPLLAATVIPMLPFVKFSRTLKRFFLHMPRPVLYRPWVMPVLFVGLIAWAVGFTEGVYRNDDNDAERAAHKIDGKAASSNNGRLS